MRHNTNCPNCGAPIEPDRIRCAYCGTTYMDLATLQLCNNTWIRVNVGPPGRPMILAARGFLSSCSVTNEVDACPTVQLEFVVDNLVAATE